MKRENNMEKFETRGGRNLAPNKNRTPKKYKYNTKPNSGDVKKTNAGKNKAAPGKNKVPEFSEEMRAILLRRKNMVYLPGNVDTNPDIHTIWTGLNGERATVEGDAAFYMSAIRNLNALGYTVSPRLFAGMVKLSRDKFIGLYAHTVATLKEMVGADKSYRPMYPGFPEQVMNMSDSELYINAIIHYLSGGTYYPYRFQRSTNPTQNTAFDQGGFTVLNVGTKEDLMEIFTNLWKSKTSISSADKEDLRTIIKGIPDFADYMPDEIPLKENVALYASLVMESPLGSPRFLKKYFKTATDVLRLIVGLSDGDLSLAEKNKLRSLKRKERNAVMYLLANVNKDTLLEDMFRYQNRWIYVGQFLHPGEFHDELFNDVRLAFDFIRNDEKPLFFGGKVQKLLNEGAMQAAADKLKTRPGEFARLLDKLLRDSRSEDRNYIIDLFKQCADKVSAPVLWQVHAHFAQRKYEAANPDKKQPVRVFFPKGNVAKCMVVENDLAAIPYNVCGTVMNVCSEAIRKQYAERTSLGKVYIDPEFKDFLVPFSQRSASKTLKTIVRGSRIPVDKDAKIVRSFIWWTNDSRNYRVDIDLSAGVLNENWGYVGHVSWTNLRERGMKCCHSGDITNGGSPDGNGVVEFLDIDIDSVVNSGGRYVIFQIYAYTAQKFSELPNLRFGWMERQRLGDGAIFEPRSVKMNMDVTADSRIAIPVVFDCVKREYIWCDLNIGIGAMSSSHYGNTLESNLKGVTASCYGLANVWKTNLAQLVYANAVSRGEYVEDRNEADLIFSNDLTPPVTYTEKFNPETGEIEREAVERDSKDYKVITAYDTDYFVGQLL